jgi:4'-phosphopantetheinyl transferase
LTWPVLSTVPDLLESDVHVWCAPLTVPEQRFDALSVLLSDDERARAGRLKFDVPRQECIVSRGTLREILGAYLALDAAGLRFEVGEQGKPSLAGLTVDLRFNVAHSGDILLVAVALDRDVGVDVEQVLPDVAFAEMTKRYFTESEQAIVTGADAFFRVWTAKEAFLKARGTGFAGGTKDFEVSLDPLRVAAADPSWQLFGLDVDDGYRAMLAVCGDAVVSTWRWR